MRVVRDPLTGEMRAPNAAESAAFEKAEAQLRLRSGKPVVQPAEVRYPDGTIETKLGDDTMMYAVVASAADGSLTFDCLPAKATQKLMLSKKTSSVTTAAKVGHVHKY